MNVVKPYAKLIDVPDREAGVKMLRKIEWCGRISHRSEDAQTDSSWERFIPAVVMQHGDWSIVEHASATAEFQVDRGVSHEIVRHRLCSFTQSSTRFINHVKKMPPEFIAPTCIDDKDHEPEYDAWSGAMQASENMYIRLIELGQPPQIARSVFPNSLATKIIVTTNLRNWRHLFLMRTTKETHPQFKEVMLPLLAEFKEKIPLLYDDIEPDARQIDNIKKGK